MSERVFWRLASPPVVAAAFRGSVVPGRWNMRGQPVYAASSIALAALERLIYYGFDPAVGLYPRQHLFRIAIPLDIAFEEWSHVPLPTGWAAMRPSRFPYAPPTPLQTRGDEWYASRRTAALLVPSAHVPEEPNLLLNPTHGDFSRLGIRHAREFFYDPRLLGRLSGASGS